MIYLLLGLSLFFAVHAVPSLSIKQSLVDSVGELKYKGLFTLCSLIGLGLIIYGKGNSEFLPLWNPPLWSRHLTLLLMLPAIILLLTSIIPNNIRRAVRHPMLLSVSLWGIGHLITNGDLASIALFSSFLIFSLSKIRTQNKRSAFSLPQKVNGLWDLATVAGGISLYGTIVYFHRFIAGVPIF